MSIIKIKGSRFLGYAAPVTTVSQAETIIDAVSRKYFDATHHCFAYRLGIGERLLRRHSDAGEPAGTAGLPIYQAIESQQISNIVVIITRYFGGTKLGKGGLVRAYREATLTVFENAQIVKEYIYQNIKIRFAYPETGEVMRLVEGVNGQIQGTVYGQEIILKVLVRQSLAERFIKALAGIQYKNVWIETNES